MRKTATITITAEGRDKGKVFLLQEMSATQAERWAARALLALCKSGLDIPENIAGAGIQGIAILGLKALGGIDSDAALSLMDEMFYSCVAYAPDPKNLNILRGARGLPGATTVGELTDDDIEEVATRVHLRSEIFTLHVGFSLGAVHSKLTLGTQATPSKNTKTSHARLAR